MSEKPATAALSAGRVKLGLIVTSRHECNGRAFKNRVLVLSEPEQTLKQSCGDLIGTATEWPRVNILFVFVPLKCVLKLNNA